MKPKPGGLVEGLPGPQRRALAAYEELLAERAIPLGLVSGKDRHRLWERHVLDSLRALPCLPASGSVLDLGSGAGLPGVPLAVCRPDLRFVLVEPKSRRAAFLELVLSRLSLGNVSVAVSRAEDLTERSAACLARALAGPREAWEMAEPRLAGDGYLLYWAGRSWRSQEIGASEAFTARICGDPRFPWQGPVVIMART